MSCSFNKILRSRNHDLRIQRRSCNKPTLLGSKKVATRRIGTLECLETRRLLAVAPALDLTFGEDGRVISDLLNPSTVDVPRGLGVQPATGNIVAFGTSGPDGRHALLRFTPDGTLDDSFGDQGRVVFGTNATLFTGGGSEGYTPPREKVMAIDSQGRILVAGPNLLLTNALGVVRFTADGEVDTTFGNAGSMVLPALELWSTLDIEVDAHDRVLVIGRTGSFLTQQQDFSILRLSNTGQLDTSFGNAGVRTIDFEGRNDEAIGVAVDGQGRIVVGGFSFIGGSSIITNIASDFRVAVAVLNSNGLLDENFGLNGKTLLNSAHVLNAKLLDIAIDSQNRIVIGSTISNQPAVLRLTPTGFLDSSFGNDGQTPIVYGDSVNRSAFIAIDSRDGVFVSGASGEHSLAVVQLDEFGAVNSSFGIGGTAIIPIEETSAGLRGSIMRDMQLDENDRPLLLGVSYAGQLRGDDFAIVRLTATGQPDVSFARDGIAITTVGILGTSNIANAVAIAQDDKLVVAGSSVVRYFPDGQVDTSFGHEGVVYQGANAQSVAVDTLGRVLLAGSRFVNNQRREDFFVTRLLSNGMTDLSFGNAGTALIDFDGNSDQRAQLLVDSLGRILVAGQSNRLGVGNDLAIARLLDNGELDFTFSADGLQTIDFDGFSDTFAGLAFDRLERIVLAGTSSRGLATGRDFSVARLDVDGELDFAFGQNGKQYVDFLGGNDDATSIVADRHNRVLIGGNSAGDFAVARLNENGELDETFADNGKQVIDLGEGFTWSSAIRLDGQDRILMAGYSNRGGTNGTDFAITRINTDGTPDLEFSHNGAQFVDFGSQSDLANALTVDRLNRPVLVGGSNQGSIRSNDFAITRLVEANRAPTSSPGGPYIVDEGQFFTLDASSSFDNESPNSNLTFEWDLDYDGTSFDSEIAGQSVEQVFYDNFPERIIALRVTDEQGLSAITTTSLLVRNVRPQNVEISGATQAVRGQTISLAVSFSDAGSGDTHTGFWRVSREGELILETLPSSQFHEFHFTPTEIATYVIEAIVFDDDGEWGAATWAVNGLATDLQMDWTDATITLFVGGSLGNDIIDIGKANDGLIVTINGMKYGPFQVDQVVVYALAGDDDVTVSNSVSSTAYLLGGAGDDRLKGGGGNNVLVGGDGDDLLVGSVARDILIGGSGQDRLIGNSSDDILIADRTAFDERYAPLKRILREWTSNADAHQRAQNIRYEGGSLGLTRIRLTGNIFADESEDILTGGNGSDWFIHGWEDRVTDLKDKVFAQDLEWITASV